MSEFDAALPCTHAGGNDNAPRAKGNEPTTALSSTQTKGINGRKVKNKMCVDCYLNYECVKENIAVKKLEPKSGLAVDPKNHRA